MQTALHIRTLAAELRKELTGATVHTTGHFKKSRLAFLTFQSLTGRQTLMFSYHPHGAGVWLASSSGNLPDTTEKPVPLWTIAGRTLIDIEQPKLDRILYLKLQREQEIGWLVIEALGPNGNLWLLNSDRWRQSALRQRDFDPDSPYQIAETGDRFDPFEVTAAALQSRLLPNQPSDRQLEKLFRGFNATLAKETLFRAGLTGTPPSHWNAVHYESAAALIRELVARFDAIETVYLYEFPSGAEIYPFKISHSPLQPHRYKSLSAATKAMVESRQTHAGVSDDRELLFRAVQKAIARLERRLEHVRADVGRAEPFEQYKQDGELLRINYDKLKRGMTHVEIINVFESDQPTRRIELDPARTPSDNVEQFFRAYRKGREGLDQLTQRAKETETEIRRWQHIEQALKKDLESALNEYAEDLKSFLPKSGVVTTRKEPTERMPYRTFALSSGVTILVGRDGSDNDRTTFDHARPYELWFHTQQCPGSHVVIRYPSKTFQPSRADIEETAAIAAWYSKARNDSLVPVAYTERRYVRKPRNAKPGLVLVEREKSIMVRPKEPKGSR